MEYKRLETNEQKELVNQHRKLVYHIARKFNVPFYEYDDIISEGMVGLIKAAITYDEKQNNAFSTYASTCIRNEICLYLRKKKKIRMETSLDAIYICDSNGAPYTLRDIICIEEEDFTENILEREIASEIFEIVLNVLDRRSRFITFSRISGKTQKETARKVHISQSYVARLEIVIREEIQKYFNNSLDYDKIYTIEITKDLYVLKFSVRNFENFSRNPYGFISEIQYCDKFKFSRDGEFITICFPKESESLIFISNLVDKLDKWL